MHDPPVWSVHCIRCSRRVITCSNVVLQTMAAPRPRLASPLYPSTSSTLMYSFRIAASAASLALDMPVVPHKSHRQAQSSTRVKPMQPWPSHRITRQSSGVMQRRHSQTKSFCLRRMNLRSAAEVALTSGMYDVTISSPAAIWRVAVVHCQPSALWFDLATGGRAVSDHHARRVARLDSTPTLNFVL